MVRSNLVLPLILTFQGCQDKVFSALVTFHFAVIPRALSSTSHIVVVIHTSFTSKGRNEPLKKDKPKWKSDYPMTEGQLRSKRDEFWDTAPAFEGRKEIWDALKAAAVALECNDQELAQAIVDGANITLPHGERQYTSMSV